MSKFKVGDRVRYKHDVGPWMERQLDSDSEGVVVRINHSYDSVDVRLGVVEDIDVEDLELVEPTDRKTAFLEELRELLIRFDASITAYSYIDGRPQFRLGLDIKVGDNLICFDDTCVGKIELTPGNIMDYDKEGV